MTAPIDGRTAGGGRWGRDAAPADFLGSAGTAGAGVPSPYPFKFQAAIRVPAILARSYTRMFPRFWLQGWIVGQNTIGQEGDGTTGSPRMCGRVTLLSVDVRSSEERLRGLDAAGTRVTTRDFFLPAWSNGIWIATFDISVAVTE